MLVGGTVPSPDIIITMMTTAVTTGSNGRKDSYLALVPRGLHHVVLEAMEEILAPHYVKTDMLGEQEPNEKDLERLKVLVQQANDKKMKKQRESCTTCLEKVGTVHDVEAGRHVSMGYRRCGSNTSVLLSHPGQLEGVVWIHLVTDAPTSKVANQLRCVGPLLALVDAFENVYLTESQSIDEAVDCVKAAVSKKSYSLDAALELWHDHVQQTWPMSEQERSEIHQYTEGKSNLAFRLSCVRHQSKRFKYTREDLLRSIADTVIPSPEWRVDLTQYNVEVVLLVQPHCLAVGLSLRPYRQLGAKCFSSGTIPPDIAKPYLSGNILSGLVRLRPSTAQLLLRLARVLPGDVALDPCAGIGTIPMEVSFGGCPAVGLGGDIVLEPSGLGSVANKYAKEMLKEHNSCGEVCAWDAASLPLRTSCVDAIVSDLPFGQQCLSSSKLDGFLPLLMGEAGRVLRPGTGRMVLLCGSYPPVLDALAQINEAASNDEKVWELPCTSVFPVNIGGNAAWIVQVQRGQARAALVANHQERVKKMANKRERIARQRAREANDPSKQSRKYRRIQS